MQRLILLPLALATATATATATHTPKRCTTPSDTHPWILSNITAFYSSNTTTTTTTTTAFTFHFTDPNAGLELDTDCACHLNTTITAGRYYGCEAGEVEFAVSTGMGEVEVQRGYGDVCQPAPYNEVKAVGMASLNLTRETTAEGTVVGRQAELEVEITEMA